ncbi:sugar phosphate isomerase/epimerase family protein [Bauldia sp.]|uniref:sugar phosphate isomerase/epimerase family protein n=1 Tax=Bauldia sp. TaxID=2575872 RepID=UPI003BAAA02D
MAFKLTLTSWSLPACSLREAAGIAKVLGIDGLDIGYFYGPALDKARLLAEPERVADEVLEFGVALPCLYHLFGNTLGDRNLADRRFLDQNAADLKQAVAFCVRAGVGVIFVLPGICNPGQGRREALAESAESLKRLLPIAAEAGVTLTIEPHVHSYLESPTLVLELLDKVPGLKLTLDYGHFACLGYRQEEVDPLVSHAAHMHLRQAKSGELQTKLEKGTLNMAAQLATLRDAGYDGYLALEYTHQDYMDSWYDDILTETIRLRDVVRGWEVA